MFGLRERACFELAKRRIRPAPQTTTSPDQYADWRRASLARAWSAFSDDDVRAKDVLDFGCGAGGLSLLVSERGPRQLVGVDLDPDLIETARRDLAARAPHAPAEFIVGAPDRIPLGDRSVDTVLAFDCVEHVMEPARILVEWARVLRPGGKVLIEWFPYLGPWGPHTEALVPIPWAHVVFGERAVIKTCERIYDHPSFPHRMWDFAPDGSLKPNKWAAWSKFADQGYVNQLRVVDFERMAKRAGLSVQRLETKTFNAMPLKELVQSLLPKLSVLGELLTSYIVVELVRT